MKNLTMLTIQRLIHQILGLCGLQIRRKPLKSKGQRIVSKLETIEYLFNSEDKLLLVLQMGRVGSKAIVRLLHNNGVKCWHSHSLSEQSSGPVYSADRFLRYRLFLDEEETRLTKPTRIITVFREPIGHIISQYFKALNQRQEKHNFTVLTTFIEKKHGILNLEFAKRYLLRVVDPFTPGIAFTTLPNLSTVIITTTLPSSLSATIVCFDVANRSKIMTSGFSFSNRDTSASLSGSVTPIAKIGNSVFCNIK